MPSPVSLEPVVKCGVSDFTSMVSISEPAVAPPQPLCSSSTFHLLKTLMTNQRRECFKNHSEMLTHHPEVWLLIKSYRQKRSSLSLPSSESACNKIVFVTTSLKRLQSPLLTQTIAERIGTAQLHPLKCGWHVLPGDFQQTSCSIPPKLPRSTSFSGH